MKPASMSSMAPRIGLTFPMAFASFFVAFKRNGGKSFALVRSFRSVRVCPPNSMARIGFILFLLFSIQSSMRDVRMPE